MNDSPFTVYQLGTTTAGVPIHPAWAWRCDTCGEVGAGHASEDGAEHEGTRHIWRYHHD